MFPVSSECGPNILLKQPSLSECTDALEEKKFFPEKKMQRLHFPLLAALLLSAPPRLVSGLGGSCRSALDCALNGDCVGGACQCAEGWTGSNCMQVDLIAPDVLIGFGSAEMQTWGCVPRNRVSAWGARLPRVAKRDSSYQCMQELTNSFSKRRECLLRGYVPFCWLIHGEPMSATGLPHQQRMAARDSSFATGAIHLPRSGPPTIPSRCTGW